MASETYGVKAPIIKDLSEVRGAGGGSGVSNTKWEKLKTSLSTCPPQLM